LHSIKLIDALNFLKKVYNREQHTPGCIGIFINPFYFARKGLAENLAELCTSLNGKILDIGCGQKPYKKYCQVSEYIGLELDTPENRQSKKADFFYDGKTMPFQSSEFDGIMLNQVLEHVFNPGEFLVETNRILKINGFILLTVPFVWDEHEQPQDFARYTYYGLKHLLNKNGFEIIKHRRTNDGPELICQLINASTYKIFESSSTLKNLLAAIIFMAPFNLLGLLASWLLPRNKDLYLDNIILAKKTKNV